MQVADNYIIVIKELTGTVPEPEKDSGDGNKISVGMPALSGQKNDPGSLTPGSVKICYIIRWSIAAQVRSTNIDHGPTILVVNIDIEVDTSRRRRMMPIIPAACMVVVTMVVMCLITA